jgi:hypothetical protein
MQEEQLAKLMTMIDDVKDSVPEGKYLEMCDTMKSLFEQKPKKLNTREWSIYNLGDNAFTVNFDNTTITITALHHQLGPGNASNIRYTVKIGDNAEMCIEGCELTTLLRRYFKLNTSLTINYTYPIKTIDGNSMHSMKYELDKYIIKCADVNEAEKKIRKHIDKLQGYESDDDGDGDDDDEEYYLSLRCESLSLFYNAIANIIHHDVNIYLIKHFNN